MVIKMNYNETLNYIHSLGKFSQKPGLERIKKALLKLGNPQNSLKTVHIAGTNGKGSTASMLASIFKTAGYKTGLYISPFVITFCERIQINGEFISEEDLCFYAKKVIDTEIALTEFEFITALAFTYFKDKNIDILICETGLGGRFDATNVFENHICTVITKIGLDHTAVLGDTLGEIATEKCGILRNCKTVVSPNQKEKALSVIKSLAKDYIIPDINSVEILKSPNGENSFNYMGENYYLSLLGDYQIENALTVIETVKNCGFSVKEEDIKTGLKNTFFPARMEILSEKPLIVLDGAHNPDGAEVLKKELEKQNEDVTAIIGMCRDKNYKEVLRLTLPFCKNAVCVKINNKRSLPAEELKAEALKYCEAFSVTDIKSAINKAIELSNGNPIFVFGSLYLASEIRPLIKK